MAFLYGFLWSLIISGIAFYKKSLTLSGMLTAIVMGTLIYGFGTYITFILLMAFFISSTLFTKLKAVEKDKGRSMIQVVSNALATLIFSIFYYYTADMIFLVISAVSVAATTADTWASELGKLSKGKTVSILTFKKIEKGISGGISLFGIYASLLGATFISLIFTIFVSIDMGYQPILWIYALIIIGGGFFGSIVDSYLGIFLQAKYLDQKTGYVTEGFVKGTGLKLISGIKYINNDIINLLMTLIVTSALALIMIL